MDDAVSEIVGEYAKQIEVQERVAQAKDAVVEAAMAVRSCQAAYVESGEMMAEDESSVPQDEWQTTCERLQEAHDLLAEACAALDRARKGGEEC